VIAVIGDLIIDQYVMGTAIRLCPEAPVPVVVPVQASYETRGGAGLVSDQVKELIGRENVVEFFGSKSRKERTFVDGRLVLRVDYDTLPDESGPRIGYADTIIELLKHEPVSMLVISDYGKGALDRRSASDIMRAAERMDIPVLVDAKESWNWYCGAFAAFPNQHEIAAALTPPKMRHVIQKLGPLGCEVDGEHVPGYEREVRDVTGAGDVFMAAFAAKLFCNDEIELTEVADFANIVAGISVTYIGTHVVTNEEIEDFYRENGKNDDVE
jgi:bifunctional ADP-heptose synthase (sugar kinase/adenylyltransferase)